MRSDGTVPADSSGNDLTVNTAWLKEAFPVGDRIVPGPGPQGLTYSQAVLGIRDTVDDLVSEVRSLTQMRGADGRPLARTLGVKPSTVEDLRASLNRVGDELGFLARVWEDLHPENETEDEEPRE
jgi:hypothetical protein